MPVIINGSTGISGTDGSAGTPAVQGTDTNTGMFFPAADRIGFASNGVQRGEFDASGNFLFNSGYGSVATAFGCRAWVNFNGTGTVAIRASGNVSSITDNGVGYYAVNFSTAMPDANYSTQVTGSNAGADGRYGAIDVDFVLNGQTTTTAGVSTGNGAGVRTDTALVCVAIFR